MVGIARLLLLFIIALLPNFFLLMFMSSYTGWLFSIGVRVQLRNAIYFVVWLAGASNSN